MSTEAVDRPSEALDAIASIGNIAFERGEEVPPRRPDADLDARSAVHHRGATTRASRREGVRRNAYRCVAVAARNRENQLRPPSPLGPVATRRCPFNECVTI
jgi:hypothetical protein